MYTLLKSAKCHLRVLQLLIALLAIWAGQSIAFDNSNSVQVHGFLSQGYFLSSDNNVYGNSSSSHGTHDLTEMGLNVSARPLKNVRVAMQGIYRHAGKVSDEARIDFALIDFTLIEHEDYRFGVRLGRVKNPLGFFNDTRDVAFTRPSVILPSIYQERARDLFLSSDGGQLYLDVNSSVGDFSFQFNTGKLKDNPKELEVGIFNSDLPGSLKSNPSYMGKLEFENTAGSTRLAFSYANVEMEYKPGAIFDLPNGDVSFELLLFSAQQQLGDLTLTAEYLRTHNSFTGFNPYLADFEPTSESYYLQANYQLNQQLQGIIRYDGSYNDIDDRDGDSYAQLTSNPGYTTYTKGYMIGLRWAPKSNWLLQAEWHKINGVSEISFVDNPSNSAAKQHWNLFALQLSYRF